MIEVWPSILIDTRWPRLIFTREELNFHVGCVLRFLLQKLIKYLQISQAENMDNDKAWSNARLDLKKEINV